jgi:iron-sulfur cluster repair protein YtfE (RIC family)
METTETLPILSISRQSPTLEIVERVRSVHHRALGEHLHRLEMVFQELEQRCGADEAAGRRAMTAFTTLKDGVCQCMIHEKCVVFPQIECWVAQSCGEALSPPPEMLVNAANGLAQQHARLFTQSCRLVRRVRDLEQAPIKRPLVWKLQSAAASFCDELDQQLFEEDCLLLPRITNWHAPSDQPERQPCPPC